MHNPLYPGEVIRELCIKPLGITVAETAKALGISPEMEIRLSIAFDTMPESWLTQQMQYDLWQLKQSRKRLKVKHLKKAA